MAAFVACPGLVSHYAAGPVAAQDVPGPDEVCGICSGPDPDRDALRVLGQVRGGVAKAQVDAGLAAQVATEDLLDDRLRDLLARFGEPVVPGRGQPERAVEVGDPAPVQGLAEGDALRPG